MPQAMCTTTLLSQGLDQNLINHLGSLSGFNWSELLTLITTYGPKVGALLGALLPLITAGADWKTILQALLNLLPHLKD